ncbi:MAG: pyridoxal phosphate-dependent aminotransferase [Lachnospiraceae bacterium]
MKKHGGNVYEKAKTLGVDKEEILDFSANISPLGIPRGVKQAMIASIDELIHYPDPDCVELKKAIAKAENVREEFIECGNGGADLLFRLALALKPKRVLLLAPTFVEYEEAMKAVGSEIHYTTLDEEFRICPEWIKRKLKEGAELFILCNPNNPTGLLTKREEILDILEEAKKIGCKVLVDECFLELYEREMDYSLKPYLDKYDNLFILKSFTKLYAIPGVRLGYILSSNTKKLEKIKSSGQAWGVSHIAQRAGVAALEEKAYKERTIKFIAEENLFLKENLRNLGIHVLDGAVNYLFFYTKQKDLNDRLEKYSILIRDCSNYQGLEKGYFRIAVNSREENIKLIEALKKIKEEVGGF